MTAAIALVQIIVPLLPQIIGDISDLVKWISSVRKAALQTGEWTELMDRNFRAAVIATGRQDPAYQS